MAQAPRTNTGASLGSDDPMENFSEWLQANAKVVIIGVSAAIIIGAGIVGYRYLSAAKLQEASAALYQAQGPLLEGKLPEAQQALQQVSNKYGNTASGQQATLLLAQVLYDEKQYQGGITMLEKAQSDASRDNQASFHAMTAAGYEGLAKLDKAADEYAKAADAAVFKTDKAQYQASEARSLMAAGKMEEARKIWQALVVDDATSAGQEAKIRLGEIVGATGK
jgi:predicted negative regulator of RcsB-dependent stress response